jgi:hypothetical protein
VHPWLRAAWGVTLAEAEELLDLTLLTPAERSIKRVLRTGVQVRSPALPPDSPADRVRAPRGPERWGRWCAGSVARPPLGWRKRLLFNRFPRVREGAFILRLDDVHQRPGAQPCSQRARRSPAPARRAQPSGTTAVRAARCSGRISARDAGISRIGTGGACGRRRLHSGVLRRFPPPRWPGSGRQ